MATVKRLSVLAAMLAVFTAAPGAAQEGEAFDAGAPLEAGAGEPVNEADAGAEASMGEADAGAALEGDALLQDMLTLETELLETVTAASQVAEPVREAPVPVTLITREMIEESGARNLLELLTLYVPGMTRAEDQNELNVAMRGIYASSQQKILILLDGHRLNSRAYSSASPDFSIGLDKLKRIEVLRGPGSSIYGNVALTAVINLVTHDGKDLKGVQGRFGVGDFGQVTGSVVAGHDFGTSGDVLLWGSYYQATGERVALFANPTGDPRLQNYSGTGADGFAILGAAREFGSYDFGAKARFGSVRLMFSRRYGKHTEPLTAAGVTGEAYRFDDQTKNAFLGAGPGLGSTTNHAEIAWADSFGEKKQWNLSATLYGDTNELGGVTTTNGNGGAINIGWNDFNVGAILQARYDYDLGKLGTGSVTAGLQWEYMRLIDSLYVVAQNTVWTTFADQSTPLLDPGREIIYSGFVMLRHKLFDSLVLNVGGRYDNKFRREGPNVQNFSPRLALAFAPKRAWDVRLSYAESFVDAPYWYRYNSLPSYRGARTLTPEQMRSVQLSGSLTLLDERLRTTLNLFYNDLYNFIYRNNNAAPTEPLYQNAGHLRSMGAELEAAWIDSWLHVRFVGAYQGAVDAKDYGTRGAIIYNVPAWSGALTLDVAPVTAWKDKLWLHAAGRFTGPQLSPVNLTFRDPMGNVLAAFNQPNRQIEAAAIFDVGVRVKNVPVKNVFLQGTVYNLFDTFYEAGGSTVHPYPQTGRWFLITVGYTFQP